MEPAGSAQLQAAVDRQDAVLEAQQRELLALSQHLRALTHSMADLAATVRGDQLTPPLHPSAPPAPSSAAPLTTHEPRLPPPEKYDGEPGSCRAFLTQCKLIFSLQPATFLTEQSRVAYIITQLTGRAKQWATAAWEADLPCVQNSTRLAEEMKRVFDRSKHGQEAGRGLLQLRQGRRSVSDYSIEFQTLATDSGWGERALYDAFLHGLAEGIKDELLTRDLPDDLNRVIELAIRVGSRLEEHGRQARPSPHRQPSPAPLLRPRLPSGAPHPHTPAPEAEPMQINRARLSKEERERRIREQACLYCGGVGHFKIRCPVKGNAHE